MRNSTQNDAIWGLIALFLTNITIDLKMNVINAKTQACIKSHRNHAKKPCLD